MFMNGQTVNESIRGEITRHGLGQIEKVIEVNQVENFFESTIEALHVNAEAKEILIEITSAFGCAKKHKISAVEVEDFFVRSMRLSNIVEKVSIYNSINALKNQEEVLRIIFILLREKEPSMNDLEWPILKEKLVKIINGECCILMLKPIYGAEIIISAKYFKLE